MEALLCCTDVNFNHESNFIMSDILGCVLSEPVYPYGAPAAVLIPPYVGPVALWFYVVLLRWDSCCVCVCL